MAHKHYFTVAKRAQCLVPPTTTIPKSHVELFKMELGCISTLIVNKSVKRKSEGSVKGMNPSDPQ